MSSLSYVLIKRYNWSLNFEEYIMDKTENKLYKIENRLGTFYIVARSYDEAGELLEKRLNDADYGFTTYREYNRIDHIATEKVDYADKSNQMFSDDFGNLIIGDDIRTNLTPQEEG